MAVTPQVSGELVDACGFGRSGHCLIGQHHKCLHRTGGPLESGHEVPAAHLTRRGRDADPSSWSVVGPSLWIDCRVCGRRHGHVWRCPCDCHSEDDACGQLDLLATLGRPS